MKKNVVTIGVTVMVVASVGCCGFSALIGQSTREAREAPQEHPDRVTQVEGQATPPEEPEPSRSVPGWMDPDRVAGEEHGAAAGLTFARIFELSRGRSTTVGGAVTACV